MDTTNYIYSNCIYNNRGEKLESKILDTKEIKESYQYNGNTKTRMHTIRSMINGNSEFINYRCGRNSVNISKGILQELTEVMNKLSWKNTTTTTDKDTDKLHAENVSLQKQINDLKNLIKNGKK